MIWTWILSALGVCCVAAAGYFGSEAARMRLALKREEEAHRAAMEAVTGDFRAAEGEREALNQEYMALLNGCGAGVLILDDTEIIERANQPACQLMGVPTQTLVGKTLLQATLSSELHNLIKVVREQNDVQQHEVRTPGLNGHALSVTILPVRGERPDRRRFVVIAHDVTALRRLETIRRDFVANVSHELRTPLATIRAMAETLQDGAMQDASVADHFLNNIINESLRLTRISEDLLILSQAESRLPEKGRIDLSRLLVEVVNRFQPQAEKGNLSLCAEVPPGLEVYANHDQLEQVVVNLVDNALKYTPGGGRVLVTAEREPTKVAVHVADTGIGIRSQDLPRIFERFYRVDKARSRGSGGTGLGLSIVKHIIEAHGGQVTVESEYNRGSILTFTLPA